MSNPRNIIFSSDHSIIDPSDPLAIVFNRNVIEGAGRRPFEESILNVMSNPFFKKIQKTDFLNSPGFNSFFQAIVNNDLVIKKDNDLKLAILNDQSLNNDLKNNLIRDLKTDSQNQPFFLRPLFENRSDLLKNHLKKTVKDDIDQIFTIWYQESLNSLGYQEKHKQDLAETAINIMIDDDQLGVSQTFLTSLSMIDPEPDGFGFDPHSFKDGLEIFRSNVLSKTNQMLMKSNDFSLRTLKNSYKHGLAAEIEFFLIIAASGHLFDLEKSGQAMMDLSVSSVGVGHILNKFTPLIEKAMSQSGKDYSDFKMITDSLPINRGTGQDILEIFFILGKEISNMIVEYQSVNFEAIADVVYLKTQTFLNLS